MSARSVKKTGLGWTPAPGRELARLAWPIAVSMLSYSVMTLVDTLFVGRLGPPALAGVGLGGVTAFALLCFPMGLLGGVKVLVSQATGAGKNDAARGASYLAAGLVLALAWSAVVIVVGQLVGNALALFTATPAVGEVSRVYLVVRVLGAPAVLVFVALREYRHGEGDTRWPMIAVLVANGANVALDWLLIFGLELGVAGAAWATVASSAIQAAILWFAPPRSAVARLRRLKSRGAWLARLPAVWRMGAPGGLQFLLEVGSFTVLSLMIAAFSEVDMAAHHIAIQVIHFTFLPGLAVSEAASVLTGQAVGAGRDELVQRVGRRALAMAGGYAVVCTVVLTVGGSWIAAGFTADPELLRRTTGLLYVAAFFQVFDAANVVARGALRGTGDVRFTAVVGIVTAWVVVPPLTWLLGRGAELGALGGWLALCVEIVVAAAIFWLRLERGRWRGAAIRARGEMAS